MTHDRRKGFTLIELMIVIAIIAVIAAIAIPGLLQSQRAANERNASASMKTLTSAQADFKVNDRDANKIIDYWTEDVKGLYTFASHLPAGVTTTNALKLIDLALAAADSATVASTATGCVNITDVTTPGAKAGYWYQAMVSDLSGDTPDLYRQATNGIDASGTPVSGAYFNLGKFGIVAYPDAVAAGKFVYIINESNTIYRRAMTVGIKASTSIPPGPQSVINTFPNATEFRSFWGKLD